MSFLNLRWVGLGWAIERSSVCSLFRIFSGSFGSGVWPLGALGAGFAATGFAGAGLAGAGF